MKTHFKPWLLGLACVLAACLPLASQAEPYFTNKEGNLIWDKATNLVWQRCSVGQTWDGKTCAGEAKKFTFDEAQKQAGNGWRVPTIRQLASLIRCSDGKFKDAVDVGDGGTAIPRVCPDGSKKPTIDPVAFPQTPSSLFWSTSSVGNSNSARDAYFEDGYIGSAERDNHSRVRLLRASQLSLEAAASTFSIALQASDSKTWSTANAIVEKIEADELRKREHRQQRSNQSNVSRQQCEAQKQTCLAQCPPLWAPDAAGYQCQGRCNKISCD